MTAYAWKIRTLSFGIINYDYLGNWFLNLWSKRLLDVSHYRACSHVQDGVFFECPSGSSKALVFQAFSLEPVRSHTQFSCFDQLWHNWMQELRIAQSIAYGHSNTRFRTHTHTHTQTKCSYAAYSVYQDHWEFVPFQAQVSHAGASRLTG